jgi:hypothetical protein
METPKGAWTFGVLFVASILIKDITLLKKKSFHFTLTSGDVRFNGAELM